MINNLPKIGQKAYCEKKYSTEDVIKFANLSGDFNKIHIDSDYAITSIFKKPIVHGIFVASQISELIANKLPGPGSIYLNQTLKFTRPVFHGDLIKCEIEVLSINSEKRIIDLKTTCFNIDGLSVIEGFAIIKLL